MSGFASSHFHPPQFGSAGPREKRPSEPSDIPQLLMNLGFLLAICLIAVVIGAASAYS